jgi:hypothetical protein
VAERRRAVRTNAAWQPVLAATHAHTAQPGTWTKPKMCRCPVSPFGTPLAPATPASRGWWRNGRCWGEGRRQMAPWRSALGRFAVVPPSSQNARYGVAKRLLVGGVEGTELSNHEQLLDGGEHGFDNGRFEKPRSLPA